MTLADFTRWVDDVFERETFLPPDPAEDESRPQQPTSSITPLARAMLRPFAAAVVPGADDRNLGALAQRDSLLPRSVAHALGRAPIAIDARATPRCSPSRSCCACRRSRCCAPDDGAEPLADSAFVERLRLALAERGTGCRAWQRPADRGTPIAPTPIRPSAPTGGADRLPRRLSASAFEALRACPYRFFALSVLGLREADELDAEVEKRDYGKLAARRAARVPSSSARAPRPMCGAAGRRASARDRRREPSKRWASTRRRSCRSPRAFAAFVPRYVAWLHERERRRLGVVARRERS